ncbi:2'-5' RNA ligase family protein [Microvirga sp. ACRRW]|uniref:2'-5' RNA ligase family protein n=1 Tax=Microvirga sp. ACRRW TaxID=2918205 RepID=UPI001EF701BB|nr:2'-5' RNA ligase family protein [Microvirga sp. ACRRW]MCG7391624.1 2'-5' RNA ligase family protein [Microvirga sp. ACRRW]
MSGDYHSIWLMPIAEQEQKFASIVRDLAKRFNSPVFQPHLTLVEDMPRSCEDLQPLVEQLADGVASFQASVGSVEESELYYRSFYARFPVVPQLKLLKERAVDLFKVGSLETFMPHISLAYGVTQSDEKTRQIAALQSKLQGLNVTFNRVCIVSSSQQTPIEQWKIRHEATLAS